MKILTLHLSDIHLSERDSSCLAKFPHIVPAIRNEEVQVDAVVIIVSGDIAYSGKKSEYEMAGPAIDSLIAQIESDIKPSVVKLVLIPGNHDCDFTKANAVRTAVINGIRGGEPVDFSIITECCKVQADFFSFQRNHKYGVPDFFLNELFWSYRVEINGEVISFRCYNTAWMSQLKESQGEIHMPIHLLNKDFDTDPCDYAFSIFHHPYNWMPSGSFRHFRKLIESTSDLAMTGHEHEADHFLKYTFSGEVNEYIEGAVMQEHGRADRAGFNVVCIDTARAQRKVINYNWNGSLFSKSNKSHDWIEYSRDSRLSRRDFDLTESWQRHLDDPGANYTHPGKPDLRLSDIYIAPNLRRYEVERKDSVGFNSIIEGRDLLKELGGMKRAVIFGRQQSGKTTMCKILFSEYYKKGLTPVLINGEEITRGHLELKKFEAVVEKFLKLQYKDPSLVEFQQLNRDKVVLIIDDVDHAILNAQGRLRFLEAIKPRYERVIVFGDDALKMEELASGSTGGSVLVDYEQLEIVQFGHLLRSKLIKQWYSIGSEYHIDSEELEKRTHSAELLITAMIGKNYLPSYPVFILSLVQAHETTAQKDTALGTYGSLYESIIMQALAPHSVVGNMNLRLTYLTEVAQWMHSLGVNRISDDGWDEFHKSHCRKYRITISRSAIKDELAKQGLFECKDEHYGFKYPAAYYYFVARYIKDHLHQDDVRNRCIKMLTMLHKDEFLSIWLFLTHLSKDPFIIEAITSHAKMLYEKISPATLDSDLEFTKGFAETVSKITLKDGDFYIEKERRLREMDEKPHAGDELNVVDDVECETNEALKMLREVNLALRTLDVLGQLVKNFSGSLEGAHKLDLVKECYLLGLRTLGMFYALIETDIDAFVELVVNRVIEQHPDVSDKDELKRKARQFMFWMTEALSLNIIKRISRAAGHPQLKETYSDVLTEVNTNAVALINMSVSLNNATFPEDSILRLSKRYEKNILCDRLLKHLVVEHFYIFPSSHEIKAKVCSALKIELKALNLLDFTAAKERSVPALQK